MTNHLPPHSSSPPLGVSEEMKELVIALIDEAETGFASDIRQAKTALLTAIAALEAENTRLLFDQGKTALVTKNKTDLKSPDTGDTAALDDLLTAFAGNWSNSFPFNSVEHEDQSRKTVRLRSAIHAHVAALVTAERESCAKIAYQWHNSDASQDEKTAVAIMADMIRARSTPSDD